jgi:hypothetical protein
MTAGTGMARSEGRRFGHIVAPPRESASGACHGTIGGAIGVDVAHPDDLFILEQWVRAP